MIRVRFAPSPTGNLHIGGARTALFNWLYAKAKGGQFILRIEDTDRQRSKDDYLKEILDSMRWLGFHWDEIYYQSQRSGIYKKFAEKLIDEGKAYYQKPEYGNQKPEYGNQKPGYRDQRPQGELDNLQEAIVFKVQPCAVKINDLIHGEIEFDAQLIKDQVLIKSDGTPTYNFACVVDDASMEITHVVRGDDHISNTPKQALLYQALGFDMPNFAHLPLILDKSGGRLSKRTQATAISEYRQLGFLPQALVNYLLLLGWSPGENREIIDLEEAMKHFDIKDANKTAAVFDLDKLNWVSNHYIKISPAEEITNLLTPMILEKFPQAKEYCSDRQWLENLIRLYQGRINTLRDFLEWADFFFLNEITVAEELKDKFLNQDLSREFRMFIERLQGLKLFNPPSIEEAFRNLVKDLNISSRKLIHPIRVALTAKTVGPGLFEVISFLGRERAKRRLDNWINKEGKDEL